MQPLWGVVADRRFGKKAVYMITRLLSTVVLLTLVLPAVTASFERTLAVSLLTSAFSSGGILDAYSLQVCGAHSRRLYGRLRMWTAVLLPLPCACLLPLAATPSLASLLPAPSLLLAFPPFLSAYFTRLAPPPPSCPFPPTYPAFSRPFPPVDSCSALAHCFRHTCLSRQRRLTYGVLAPVRAV